MKHYCTPLPPPAGEWLSVHVQTACGIIEPPVRERTGYPSGATCPRCIDQLSSRGRRQK